MNNELLSKRRNANDKKRFIEIYNFAKFFENRCKVSASRAKNQIYLNFSEAQPNFGIVSVSDYYSIFISICAPSSPSLLSLSVTVPLSSCA